MDTLQKIRKLMDERNWSEYHLSKVSGVPQSTINSMFRKNNQPTIPTLECICDAFNISVSEFFWEKDDHRIITTEQKRLLEVWQLLSGEKRRALLQLIQLLVKEQ